MQRMAHIMAPKTWFCLSSLLWCVTAVPACQEIRFKNNILRKGILCSAQTEDMSTVEKKVNLFRKENVIGIYALPKAIGHVCYWKPVESGLVDLMTLSGGIFHMIGKVNLLVMTINSLN